MNLKRFSIISAIIIGLLIATLITLACVKVDNGLSINDPSKIIVYTKSTVGTEYSEEKTPAKYKKVKKLYNEMTNLSVIDYMITGKSLRLEPSQDLDQEYPTWDNSKNKSNYYCVELIFDEKQSIIVNIDGNTKVIEFYALIMTIQKSNLSREVAVYFSTTEGTSKNYSSSPILINAKQNGLFEYIQSMNDEK